MGQGACVAVGGPVCVGTGPSGVGAGMVGAAVERGVGPAVDEVGAMVGEGVGETVGQGLAAGKSGPVWVGVVSARGGAFRVVPGVDRGPGFGVVVPVGDGVEEVGAAVGGGDSIR